MPVSALATVMVAFGTTAPLGSLTLPTIDPVVVWANSQNEVENIARNRRPMKPLLIGGIIRRTGMECNPEICYKFGSDSPRFPGDCRRRAFVVSAAAKASGAVSFPLAPAGPLR